MNIKQFYQNKKILVTGGAGTIGEALLKELLKYTINVVTIDHDEFRLFNLNYKNIYICDIKDRNALNVIFEKYKFDIVFHCAAFKHVPLIEAQTPYAIQNNVIGTLNVVEVANFHGVKKLINISTDKSVNPISVMGLTKKMGEKIAQHYGYTSVRFGNVKNSRGSLYESWQEQLNNNQPLTITDWNCTRYFMSIEQAVDLILTVGTFITPAIYILKMGKQITIKEVYDKFAKGYPVKITGLRYGERLHERLWEDWEQPKVSKEYPNIWRIDYE